MHISTQAFSSGEIDLQVSTLIQTMGFLGLGAAERPCPVVARAPDTEDRASSSAAMQRIGPIIGTVDIVESEDSYLFQVSLPGVRRDQCKFIRPKSLYALFNSCVLCQI